MRSSPRFSRMPSISVCCACTGCTLPSHSRIRTLNMGSRDSYLHANLSFQQIHALARSMPEFGIRVSRGVWRSRCSVGRSPILVSDSRPPPVPVLTPPGHKPMACSHRRSSSISTSVACQTVRLRRRRATCKRGSMRFGRSTRLCPASR